MANQIPVKAIYSGSDVTSLGEFTASDDITITYLPTGTSSSTVALGDHTHATYLPLAGGTMTGNLVMGSNLVDGVDISARDAVLTSTATTASAAMPKAGGAFTGAITTNSTIDTVDIATRDGVLTTTTTTANAALPKAGGTMTGGLTVNAAAVFNESSADVDFRVESNGNANMIFVDGGNDKVAIGTGTATAMLTVEGNAVAKTNTDTSNSGTVDLDFATNQNFVLTLDGNITSLTASNEVVGQSGFIAFIQDGTGGRTVALHGDYETAAAAGLTLTATASATDLVPYLVVASNRVLLGTPQLAFA